MSGLKKGFLLTPGHDSGAPRRSSPTSSPRLTKPSKAAQKKYGDQAFDGADKTIIKIPADPSTVEIDKGYTEDFDHEAVQKFFEDIRDAGLIEKLALGDIDYLDSFVPPHIAALINTPVNVTIKKENQVGLELPPGTRVWDFTPPRRHAITTSYGTVFNYGCEEADLRYARNTPAIRDLYYSHLNENGWTSKLENEAAYTAVYVPDVSAVPDASYDCVNLNYSLSKFARSYRALQDILKMLMSKLKNDGRLSFILPHGDINHSKSPLGTILYTQPRGSYPLMVNHTEDDKSYSDCDLFPEDIQQICVDAGWLLELVPNSNYKSGHSVGDAVSLYYIRRANIASHASYSQTVILEEVHVSPPVAIGDLPSNDVQSHSSDSDNNNNVRSKEKGINEPVFADASNDLLPGDLKAALRRFSCESSIEASPDTLVTEWLVEEAPVEAIARFKKYIADKDLHHCHSRDASFSDLHHINKGRMLVCKRDFGLHGILAYDTKTERNYLSVEHQTVYAVRPVLKGSKYHPTEQPYLPLTEAVIVNVKHYAKQFNVGSVVGLLAIDCTYKSGLLGRINFLRHTIRWLPVRDWIFLPDLIAYESKNPGVFDDGMFISDAGWGFRKWDHVRKRNAYPVLLIPDRPSRIIASNRVDMSIIENSMMRLALKGKRTVAIDSRGIVSDYITAFDEKLKNDKGEDIPNPDRVYRASLDTVRVLAVSFAESRARSRDVDRTATKPVVIYNVRDLFGIKTSVNDIMAEIPNIEKLTATYPHVLSWPDASEAERSELYVARHARFRTLPASNAVLTSLLSKVREIVPAQLKEKRKPPRT